MKRAFITGITGFVGSALAKRLLDEGYLVTGLTRNLEKYVTAHPNFSIYMADLNNYDQVEERIAQFKLLDENTTIFHCAATLGAAQASKKTYMRVNVELTKFLYQLGLKYKISKFVFISSMGAAGPVGSRENPITEETPTKPIAYYSQSKRIAEQYLESENKIPTIILRPPNIFGPNMNPKSGAAMVFKGCRRRFFPVIGNAKNYINFAYIDNVVEGIISCTVAVAEGTEIFFISDETPYITQEMMNEIKSQIGSKTRLIKIPYYPMLFLSWLVEKFSKLIRRDIGFNTELTKGLATNAYVFSIEKAKSVGFNPPIDLKTGVAKTLAGPTDD